jgi:hypothetical protein
MADEPSRNSELVYLPGPSWYPALVAAGIAGVVASTFTWWPYGAIGAAVAIVALAAWIRDSSRDREELPREQRVTLAHIPATPLKRLRD